MMAKMLGGYSVAQLILCCVSILSATSVASTHTDARRSARTPLVLVPRFNGGSEPLPGVSKEEFAYNMGFPPQKLRLGATYMPIVEQLQKAGYKMYVSASLHPLPLLKYPLPAAGDTHCYQPRMKHVPMCRIPTIVLTSSVYFAPFDHYRLSARPFLRPQMTCRF